MKYLPRISLASVSLIGAIVCANAGINAADVLPDGGGGVMALATVFGIIFLLCLIPWGAFDKKNDTPKTDVHDPDSMATQRDSKHATASVASRTVDPRRVDAPQGATAAGASAFAGFAIISGLVMTVMGILGFVPARFAATLTPGTAVGAGILCIAIGLIAFGFSRSDESAAQGEKLVRWFLYLVLIIMLLVPVLAVGVLIFERW